MKRVGYIELIERFGLETMAPEPRSHVPDWGRHTRVGSHPG